jgi:prevent-host-death family protein
MFNKIVDEVEGTDELYVLTKNGKPAAVVVGVNHLEKLTGESNISVTSSPPYPVSSNDNSTDVPSTNPQESSNNPEEEVVFASAEDVFTDNNASNNNMSANPEPNELTTPNSLLTTENNHSLANTQPTLDTQNSTQVIKPIPDDFSEDIPVSPISEEIPDTSENTNNPQPDINSNDSNNNENYNNIDPFSTSSTIAEMNEEDVFGTPNNNQNNSDNSYPPQQLQ